MAGITIAKFLFVVALLLCSVVPVVPSQSLRAEPDTWATVNLDGAPAPRLDFTMVWSGQEAIILNTGGRYTP